MVMRTKVVESVESHYEDHQLVRKEHFVNDKLNRDPEEGPAITYYKNGFVTLEEYFQVGKLHRTDGPAVVEYWQTAAGATEVWKVEYWVDDKMHRMEGPADYCTFHDDDPQYYKHGRNVTEEVKAAGVKPYTVEFKFFMEMI